MAYPTVKKVFKGGYYSYAIQYLQSIMNTNNVMERIMSYTFLIISDK